MENPEQRPQFTQAQRKMYLLSVLNKAWACVEPKPKYDDVNCKFVAPNPDALRALEKEHPIIGLSDHADLLQQQINNTAFGEVRGMTWASVIATITDALVDDRLGIVLDDNTGEITGFAWTGLHGVSQ